MNVNNFKILVSSSLIGRDLAIIKSILNIESHYGHLNFEYTHDSIKSNIFISKDFEDDGAKYYALIKNSQSSIVIKPTLNPNSLRALFLQIGKLPIIENFKQNLNIDKPLLTQVYKFLNSGSTKAMIIEFLNCYDCMKNDLFSDCANCKDYRLVLCPNADNIYSTAEIDEKFFLKLKVMPTNELKIHYVDCKLDNALSYNLPLLTFKWKLGLLLHEDIFDPVYENNDFSFKQVSWPDYGQLPFQKEFIQLSAILWKRAETYASLIKLTQFNPQIINKFLNALCLSKHVIIVDSVPRAKSNKQGKKASHFLSALKSIFSKKR